MLLFAKTLKSFAIQLSVPTVFVNLADSGETGIPAPPEFAEANQAWRTNSDNSTTTGTADKLLPCSRSNA